MVIRLEGEAVVDAKGCELSESLCMCRVRASLFGVRELCVRACVCARVRVRVAQTCLTGGQGSLVLLGLLSARSMAQPKVMVSAQKLGTA